MIEANASDPGSGRTFRRGLVTLMSARLALAVVSLGFAVALETSGEHVTTAGWQGFYATVAFTFLATVALALGQRWVRHPHRFAALNVATDVAIVTALVHYSGGADSAFTFLYVLVAVYGAILFEMRGALAAAALAAATYGAVLLAGDRGWIEGSGFGPPLPQTVLLTLWVVHTGAIVLVATLASLLTAELRRTGEALHQRTSDLERLRSLHQRTVESLMSGLLTTDSEGRVTSLNPEAERIAGITMREAVGKNLEEVIPGMRALVDTCERGGGGQRMRARLPFRDPRGREQHLGAAAYILRDGGRTPSGYVVIFQDVTQVVEMERDLRRSERLAAVGQLSASIAHEIRNPLASITGSIQILRAQLDRAIDPAEARQLMDIVIRETDRLNHLITDFLDFARPGPRRLEPVRVEAAVRDVVQVFEAGSPPGLEVRVDVEDRLTVSADAAQLHQVLWNLVLNASEAMAESGGVLSIVARRLEASQEPSGGGRNATSEGKKERIAEIAVGDQGGGIAPEALEHIFDPFFTTKPRGSGLGLATVHRIVDDHGGSVRVESRRGEGTVMKLRLPLAEA